jgi:hypothetical protein
MVKVTGGVTAMACREWKIKTMVQTSRPTFQWHTGNRYIPMAYSKFSHYSMFSSIGNDVIQATTFPRIFVS